MAMSLPTLRRVGLPEPESVRYTDVVVVGAGVAGLTAALGCSPRSTLVLTKGELERGSASLWAQGGVAAAIGEGDDPTLHAADTLAVAADLAKEDSVRILTREGPGSIRRLIELGAVFDRDETGSLALGCEGAHGRRRILHADGDATGAEMVRALASAVRQAPGLEVMEGAMALDLVLEEGPRGRRVCGVLAEIDGRRHLFLASAVVLATGGVGRLYLHTTNPPMATGDGLAMAARAGARLVDLEFVQFHPTALAADNSEPGAPLPLITEALRGEGAVLIDDRGERFMVDEHSLAELAPRDIVARAIHRRLADGRKIFLDATKAVGDRFPDRFPTVFGLCREKEIDPRSQPIPVTPAAHYHMGGIAVDADGRTSLPGLWACGEVTSTGVHGANRLASNSLLEGLVFGDRVARDLRHRPLAVPGIGDSEALRALRSPAPAPSKGGARERIGAEIVSDLSDRVEGEIRTLMWRYVALVRSQEDLARTASALSRLDRSSEALTPEVRNLLTVARLVTAAALARRESRGGHFRSDFPSPTAAWRRRQFARFEDRSDGTRVVALELGRRLSGRAAISEGPSGKHAEAAR